MRFFVLNYVGADSFVVIGWTWNCTCGVFRKSFCVICYIIVCLFVVGSDVMGGGVGVRGVSSVLYCK